VFVFSQAIFYTKETGRKPA